MTFLFSGAPEVDAICEAIGIKAYDCERLSLSIATDGVNLTVWKNEHYCQEYTFPFQPCPELAKSLGFDGSVCRSLTFEVKAGDVATVKTESFVKVDSVAGFVKELQSCGIAHRMKQRTSPTGLKT
jgi:hypothetical protein